jgi:peptidoglycan/LPS O-acetylase OafA/YrhL
MTSLIKYLSTLAIATPLPVACSNAQDGPAYGADPGATRYSSAGKPGRIEFVDALRVVLIALVVAHHSVEAYVVGHPSEIPLPDAPIPRAWVFLWVNAAFFMGLFFFLAGCFSTGAFDRKGVTTFLADRGLRLGVPLVLGTVLVVPLAGWSHIALDPALPNVGYWTYLTQDFFARGQKPDFWPPGERWPAFNFGHGTDSSNWRACIDEAFLCVGFCIGLPVLFRELKLGASRSWRVLADNVFAVYVFHMAIVLLLQWALIDAPVPKWVRLVATVVGAIVGSFAFTNWFILRLPYSRRVF